MFDFIHLATSCTCMRHNVPSLSVLNLDIPSSYRSFLEKFGYSRFGGLVLLYAPISGHPDDLSVRAKQLRRMLIDSLEADIAELEPDGSPELLTRLVPFGVSENGHTFGWDPRSVVGSEPEVVAIGAKVLSVRRTGLGFVDFLSSLATPEGASRLLGSGATPLPPTVEPLCPIDH